LKVTKKGKTEIKNKNIDKKNNQKNIDKSVQNEWFYMSPMEVNASMIAELSREVNFGETELWDELNILEIVLSDKGSVDFEPQRYDFQDEEDLAFVNDRGIKTIFAITFSKCSLEDFRPFAQNLLNKWEGVFCADTLDFNPRIENKDM
jgi:hypothetical protein